MDTGLDRMTDDTRIAIVEDDAATIS